MPVDKALSETKFGLLTEPKDNNLWIALVIANRNSFLNSGVPTGHYTSKLRELNVLGYYAAIVSFQYISVYNTIQCVFNNNRNASPVFILK